MDQTAPELVKNLSTVAEIKSTVGVGEQDGLGFRRKTEQGGKTMTMQPSASRPASKSVGAAVVGILLTLLIFATIMLSFLIAPLVLLLGAYFIYAMLRPRGRKKTSEPAQVQPGGQPAPLRQTHGFGTGAN